MLVNLPARIAVGITTQGFGDFAPAEFFTADLGLELYELVVNLVAGFRDLGRFGDFGFQKISPEKFEATA